MGPMARCPVFPQRTHFVDDRNAMTAADADRREGVEDRRVRVQNLRAYFVDDLVEATPEIADDLQLASPGQPRAEPNRRRRAQKLPITDAFARRPGRVMLAAGQQHRLPSQGPLLIDDAERAQDVATLQRQRMVEDVQNLHWSNGDGQNRYMATVKTVG